MFVFSLDPTARSVDAVLETQILDGTSLAGGWTLSLSSSLSGMVQSDG